MKTALVLWCTFFLVGEFRAEICRSCDRVSTVNECVSSVTYGENQICFMERNLTAQRKALYSGGCRARTLCSSSVPAVIGKREIISSGEQLACSKCCYGETDCNIKLCGDQLSNRPPKIVIQSDTEDMYVAAGQSFDIPCVADGQPDSVYRWKYNGLDFDPSGIDGAIVQVPNEGTLRFAIYQEKYEGKYQCFADNGYGVSASRIFNIRTAKLNNFSYEPQRIHRAQSGSSVTLPCYSPRSLPRAKLQWVLMDKNDTWQSVHDSERIMMDTDGRLRFLNVMKSDEQNGKTYRCMANNSVTGQHKFGPEHVLDVVGDEQRLPANFMWFSPTWQIFRRTETLELTCIFSGNPTPDVYWRKPDGSSFSNRTSFTSYGRQLRITDVDYSDAGQYECMGSNSETAVGLTRQFDVVIEATPYWKVKPKDVETVVGKTATFFSLADGVPSPSYNWYINGIPLEENKDPRIYHNPRFSQTAGNNLTLAGLTLEDHMNIQCNVSNKHGYIFADVYLNVLP